MPPAVVIPMTDSSCVGEVRRAAARLTAALQFNEVDQGRVAIVATELATNLLRHAQNGRMILQDAGTASEAAIDLLSLDSGPGIANIEKSLRDGFSTAGTAGNGLGAIRRLSDVFDLYSQTERGTVILSRVVRQPDESLTRPPPRSKPVRWAAIAVPARGEDVCGDAYRVFESNDNLSVMVADGLGHGPLAAEASEKAAAQFESMPHEIPSNFIQKAHRALAGTRGAAIANAGVDLLTGDLTYCGVGNVSGRLCTDSESRGLCSHNGILGVQIRKSPDFRYSAPAGGLLVMHSDGFQTRWTLDDYPGLILRHPGVIVGILYRDFVRGRDDASVVVAQWTSSKGHQP